MAVAVAAVNNTRDTTRDALEHMIESLLMGDEAIGQFPRADACPATRRTRPRQNNPDFSSFLKNRQALHSPASVTRQGAGAASRAAVLREPAEAPQNGGPSSTIATGSCRPFNRRARYGTVLASRILHPRCRRPAILPRFLQGAPPMFARTVLTLSVVAFLCCQLRAEDPWVVYEGKDGPGKGKHIVFVTGDEEYRSEESMPQLAKIAAVHHGFTCTVLS